MRIDAEEGDKENVSRLVGGGVPSTSYLQRGDGARNNAASNAAAYKSTRSAPRAGGDVKVPLSFLFFFSGLGARVTGSQHWLFSPSLSLAFLSFLLKKTQQCLVSYSAGAADAARLASRGSRGGEVKDGSAANCAPVAAAPLDVDVRRQRQQKQPEQQPAAAAAETTPAPLRRRVEWHAEADEPEMETPLTQQQQQHRKSRSRDTVSESSAVVCFLLDLFSWRDPPLSLLALAAFSAALHFLARSSSSPLSASSLTLVSHLVSALSEKSPVALLCHLALFDLGVNSLRGLVSEGLRERGTLSGSVAEAATAAAAASAVRGLCSLRDAALNPRDPKAALRTAVALVAASCFFGGGGGGGGGRGAVIGIGLLKELVKVAAVSAFYSCFAAGAAWRWWPRRKQRSSSSSSSRRRPPTLLRPDLGAAASFLSERASSSLSLCAEKTGISALTEFFSSLVELSLGTRVALGSLAAAVAWRLSAWSTRGAAALLLLLFARAHVFGEKASKEMARRAMRHPVLASARKGCAAWGSAARERVMMRRRRRREEEEEEEFFEEERGEHERRGRGRGVVCASELYSSRLQAAANAQEQQRQRQQQQQMFPHSSRPALRRGAGGQGGGIR